MTRDDFIQKMTEKGKLTQDQIDKIRAKNAAKAKYKKDKDKLTKAEMQTVLDALTS